MVPLGGVIVRHRPTVWRRCDTEPRAYGHSGGISSAPYRWGVSSCLGRPRGWPLAGVVPRPYGAPMTKPKPNPWPELMAALRAYQRSASSRSGGEPVGLFDAALAILRDLPEWMAYAYSAPDLEDDTGPGGTMSPVQGYTEAITWLVMMARDYGRPAFSRMADERGYVPQPFTGGVYAGYVDDPTAVAGIRPVTDDHVLAAYSAD